MNFFNFSMEVMKEFAQLMDARIEKEAIHNEPPLLECLYDDDVTQRCSPTCEGRVRPHTGCR